MPQGNECCWVVDMPGQLCAKVVGSESLKGIIVFSLPGKVNARE